MRLSTTKDDPGFRVLCSIGGPSTGIRITLNGIEERQCFTADEEEGMVIRYKTDGEGSYLLNDLKDDILIEELHGKVEISFPDRAKAE